ncbi:MAG TPA: ATP-binding protein, partial [Actinomycetota bacterium]|nr:ATP-binding protein [Actinomycetota bacterium]
DNAVRHAREGGSVRVRASRGDGSLTIEVADDGRGFDPAFLPKAFDPFTRSEDGRGRDGGGAGLGLAIVKAVAEAHGGSAHADGAPDGGARVTIALPAT